MDFIDILFWPNIRLYRPEGPPALPLWKLASMLHECNFHRKSSGFCFLQVYWNIVVVNVVVVQKDD